MQITQIYSLMNSVTDEILGRTDLVAEDLSNVVDVGTEIFDNTSVDDYVKSLINHVGKMVFVDRPYSGSVPSLYMDAWEFGSVLEKVQADIPEATENESWSLEDGKSYDPNVFYQPKVSAKFFNKKVTFDVPMSFTELQVKQSFSNAAQLNAFVSMLYNSVDKSMTVKMDSLVMRTINNMIGETIYAEYGTDDVGSKSTVKAVNILKLFNDKFNKSLTADESYTDPDFIKFCNMTMNNYIARLAKLSTLFNIGEKERFTPKDYLHVVLLNDYVSAANSYLQSDTFHDEFTRLPEAETVAYWQAPGTDYSFEDISKIDIKTASGHDVKVSGILGIMFDRDACGVANLDKRTTSYYNPKAEFYNNWYKFDAGYFNDTNENFVVFFVADAQTEGE